MLDSLPLSPVHPVRAVVSILLLAGGVFSTVQGASATVPAAALPPHARLALIGDSITEQMLYTQYVEAYLLACAGRTDVSVFQFGWGGETAATVLNRIERGDLDAFHPTAVTVAYGANDGGSQVWADWLRVMWTGRITAVLTTLEKRYPGLTPHTVICSPTFFELNRDGTNAAGVATSNDTLGRFRDLDMAVAQAHACGFADLRQCMLESSAAARAVLGPTYRIGGNDGVHAGPNGHLLMAYEILKALRMTGDIATITVNGTSATAVTTSPGHTVLSHAGGTITIASLRYPFCMDYDHSTAADRLRTIEPFVPFTSELNRFMLVVTHCDAASATVTWGAESHRFTRAELHAGVNLAAAFTQTPFDQAFASVMERMRAQELKERDMIKAAGDATAPAKGWTDADVAARTVLDSAVHAAVVSVTHTITIVPNLDTAAQMPRLANGTATGSVGVPLSVQVSVSDGPVTFSSTDLPDGLRLDATSGVLSGVPTAIMTDQVVHIRASNAAGTASGTMIITIQAAVPVPQITSARAITGVAGSPFSYQIASRTTPTKYYATGLPNGLSVVSATGEIRGVPSAAGTTEVLISAENAGGNGPAVTLSITIVDPRK